MSDIAGRHVLITGGASGIGRLMALHLASRGARVTVWDINREALDRVGEEIGMEARGLVCDVASRQQVYARAAESIAAAGPVDILINNAGIVSGADLPALPDAKIEATFAINVLALFWTCKAFLPSMIERNCGHVVTIASASGLVGVAHLAAYSASKWAAVGFDESLRAELRVSAPGVVTTVVCPYYIDTGMFRGVRSRFPFLLPILKEGEVARRVVRAIETDRRRLIMPWLCHFVPLIRVLPIGLFDGITDFLGVNTSMKGFVGRADDGSVPPAADDGISCQAALARGDAGRSAEQPPESTHLRG